MHYNNSKIGVWDAPVCAEFFCFFFTNEACRLFLITGENGWSMMDGKAKNMVELSNAFINVLSATVVGSVEIKRRHYFRSVPCTKHTNFLISNWFSCLIRKNHIVRIIIITSVCQNLLRGAHTLFKGGTPQLRRKYSIANG